MKKVTRRQIIKADPGWFVATLVRSGKTGAISWNDHLSLDPIIAWDIEHCDQEQLTTREIMPITFFGTHYENQCGATWVIKRSDGWFETADGVWEREADVVQELMEVQTRLEQRAGSA